MEYLGQIREQIGGIADAKRIYLFGSQAKGTARPGSDIDLCIVARTEHKRRLLTELYFQVDSELPIDFLLYTPEEWEQCLADEHSFANVILREGVLLYG